MRALLRTMVTAGMSAVLTITPAVMREASAGDSGRYVGAGVAVARANGQNAADDGAVVCDNGDGVGAGGLCLKFGGGNAVHVVDEALGEDVPFQVCVDNSGDGVCTSPDFGSCADQMFFSHDDDGAFFNPVGPLPTGFASGCQGGPWKGYVVMLCEGAHAVGTDMHTHPASSGTGTVTSGGEGAGTFCGGTPIAQSRKPYRVGSGARYVSGGTAASRADGTTVVDEGTVACNDGDNNGVGGFCTSFGGGNAMAVFDDVAGTDVAFQVCIDNSGDGVCTSPDTRPFCADEVFFSHDDNGAFYNPVGPLPTGFSPGCGFGAWDGYVVFLCEGTHVAGITPHAHAATTGVGRVTTGGEGLGTFCGGSYGQPSGKRYRPGVPSADVPDGGTFAVGDGPCRLRSASNSTVTGQETSEGTIAGSFFGNAGENLLMRCFVRVSGVVRAFSDFASGVTVVTVPPQRVTFTRAPTDVLEVCAEVIRGSGTVEVTCADTTTTQAPPQEIEDAAEPIIEMAEDADHAVQSADEQAEQTVAPFLCPLLAPFSTQIGPFQITPQGDVFLGPRHLLDCP